MATHTDERTFPLHRNGVDGMTVTVSGRTLTGYATAPVSKSVLHRLLICAALADTPTRLSPVTRSQDIDATVNCLRALGAQIVWEDTALTVTPLTTPKTGALLDCGESGSTLRFLLPIVAALGGGVFTGRGRLAQRPLSPLYELLAQNGCTLSPQGAFPLTVTGRLNGNRFSLDGGVSSQFISGLLMAAPLLGTDCEVVVTGTVESRAYIDLTVAALRHFGVAVTEHNAVYTVPAGARYHSPGEVVAEGDWSNGAAWLAAGALVPENTLTVTGLGGESLQGDRAVVSLLREMGASVTETVAGMWHVCGGVRHPFTVDVSQIPDLVPVLAILAAGVCGRSTIGNARRLRLKESDRLDSVHALLIALGCRATQTKDSLIIDGTGRLRGGTVDACNDHRIAMAAAVAACICDQPVTITGAEAVQKSYPRFFVEFAERGMSVCPPYLGEN